MQGGSMYVLRQIITGVLIILLGIGSWGCRDRNAPQQLINEPSDTPNQLASHLAEVSPPQTIQALKAITDRYQPQVRILSPRPDDVIQDTTVEVRLQVRDLPLFKHPDWQLGPHLHVFLDDQLYQAVYDTTDPLVFENLAPGTHTLRVFASRPWHESFKNQGAYAQTTFHLFTQTPDNVIDPDQPLLTYSRPQGSYGAEPIMLDAYLTNAPLHMIAQEDREDNISDWRLRCTINGQSFVFDRWQPIYLEGFRPGQNWVKLELLDDQGNPIENTYNTTVRLIQYTPGGDDTLSRLVRDELTAADVGGIVDPDYVAPAPESEAAEEAEEAKPGTEAVKKPEESKATGEDVEAETRDVDKAGEAEADTEAGPKQAEPEAQPEIKAPTDQKSAADREPEPKADSTTESKPSPEVPPAESEVVPEPSPPAGKDTSPAASESASDQLPSSSRTDDEATGPRPDQQASEQTAAPTPDNRTAPEATAPEATDTESAQGLRQRWQRWRQRQRQSPPATTDDQRSEEPTPEPDSAAAEATGDSEQESAGKDSPVEDDHVGGETVPETTTPKDTAKEAPEPPTDDGTTAPSPGPAPSLEQPFI